MPDSGAVPDPFALWRDWVARSERQWNQILNDVMASDQWNQSTGQLLEVQLGLQKSFADSMGRYVATLNIATRADVLGLGEHLAAIEARLERIEATLAGHRAEGPRVAAPAVPRPPRTRRPPVPAGSVSAAAPADSAPGKASTS